MTPRRVLHVLATAQEKGTAIARFVRVLAHGLDPSRYRLEAWFLGGDGPLADELRTARIPVRTFGWSGNRRDLVGAWSFWRSLRTEAFAVAHLNFGGRAVPLLVRSAHRTKIVLHLHDTGAEAGKRTLAVPAWTADSVVAVSQAVARVITGARPRVVHCGIDIPAVERNRRPPAAGHPVIGAASRLVPIKGIVYAIRAVARLREEFPQVRLQVAGAGPEEAALRAEVHALGLDDRVVFVGWQRDMRPLLEQWDVFVQPSLDEGFGMAALEAMAAGLPVVGAMAGGIPELIEDGCTGYLVPPADVTALAGRLRDVLLNPGLRHSMGAAARARVRERFSVEQMAAKLAAIYDALLAPRAHPP